MMFGSGNGPTVFVFVSAQLINCADWISVV